MELAILVFLAFPAYGMQRIGAAFLRIIKGDR
jgi:hypothetical protein